MVQDHRKGNLPKETMRVLATFVLLVGCVSGQLDSKEVHQPPKLPTSLTPENCPPTYENHPLILISMDGFRADYLTRGLTPTIAHLGQIGVRAPYMKPSFPTITFPNHYTLASGMIPPAHGIISNKFYDPAFEAEFRPGRPASYEQRWWGGEPIWKTVDRQGKISASFYWPGDEVTGHRATYVFPYNQSNPFTNRIDQVLAWLDLPENERPAVITLYLHQPDRAGHDFGLHTPQITDALIHVDQMVKRLLEGLLDRDILSCVNLMLAADHGMVEAGHEETILLDEYIPNLKDRSRFWKGAFVRIQPNDESEAVKQEMLEALSCKRPEFRVYERTKMPVRWHMGTQARIEEIVVNADAGWSIGGDSNFEADFGEHGYDNFFPTMNALFVGYGPEFRTGIEVEAFQNIELYNLMCHLVGVEPSPNNGTWGALHHMLAYPPPSPREPMQEPLPELADIPSEDESKEILMGGSCEGDSMDGDEWMEILADSHKKMYPIMNEHLPWGLPAMGEHGKHVVLLPHHDTMTAYSQVLGMPLWTSFTTTGLEDGGTNPVYWKTDVRLGNTETGSCNHYSSLLESNMTRQPLFPPEFTRDNKLVQMPYLISNAVPVTQLLSDRWQSLLTMVKGWTQMSGPLNVITGPVFDHDFDTYVDNLESLGNHNGLAVPTHLFMVVSRCLKWVDHLSRCPDTHVDTIAFVFPQSLAVSNCLTDVRFAQENMAKVTDVEKITGLTFFTNMAYDDRVRLAIRIHSNLWGRESWQNRLLTNFFGIGK